MMVIFMMVIFIITHLMVMPCIIWIVSESVFTIWVSCHKAQSMDVNAAELWQIFPDWFHCGRSCQGCNRMGEARHMSSRTSPCAKGWSIWIFDVFHWPTNFACRKLPRCMSIHLIFHIFPIFQMAPYSPPLLVTLVGTSSTSCPFQLLQLSDDGPLLAHGAQWAPQVHDLRGHGWKPAGPGGSARRCRDVGSGFGGWLWRIMDNARKITHLQKWMRTGKTEADFGKLLLSSCCCWVLVWWSLMFLILMACRWNTMTTMVFHCSCVDDFRGVHLWCVII